MMEYTHQPERISEIVNGVKWAVFTDKSIRVPAEGEWSPGHGYPEHYEYFVKVEFFADDETLTTHLRNLSAPEYGAPTKFKVFAITPTEVTTEVVVKINE